MPNNPPVPVIFLYDPEEFWEHVRVLIREEVARSKPLYTADEVSQLFHISKKEINDWIRRDTLKPIRINGRVYFLTTDIQSLLK
jgi:hypothetical protein